MAKVMFLDFLLLEIPLIIFKTTIKARRNTTAIKTMPFSYVKDMHNACTNVL